MDAEMKSKADAQKLECPAGTNDSSRSASSREPEPEYDEPQMPETD